MMELGSSSLTIIFDSGKIWSPVQEGLKTKSNKAPKTTYDGYLSGRKFPGFPFHIFVIVFIKEVGRLVSTLAVTL